MKEQWIKWEPIEGLDANNSIDAVIDNPDKFKIILLNLNSETNKTLITFNQPIVSYWFTKEILLFDTVTKLRKHHGKDFLNWTFFKVTNSNYLTSLLKKSGYSNNSLPYIHFSFFTDEENISVIATHEPTIEIFAEEEK